MKLAGAEVDKKVEKIGKVIDYLRENGDAFTSSQKWQILQSLDNEYFEWGMHDHICLQVYDELGLLPDSNNPYKVFSSLVDEKFNIKNKKVIEIGGGNIPRLGKRIADMQDKGTITVYDPNLYIKEGEEYPRLTLIKRRFSSITNVSSADVLIGLLPCGSSSLIVKSAIRYNKDFMIALCDEHNNLELFDEYEDTDSWIETFIKHTSIEIEKNKMGKLKVKHMKEIGEQYPIIYNDRG